MVDAAVLPLRDALTAAVRPALLVLLGVVGLLLLVACANVTTLSLAQASARGNELAIRSALGVSRWRLVRQFLAEAFLLSFLASCFGIASASFGIRVLRAVAPGNISPVASDISLNLPVLGFGLALCVAVAAGLGVLTALREPGQKTCDTSWQEGPRHKVRQLKAKKWAASSPPDKSQSH